MNFRNLYIVFICVICLLSGVLFSSFFLIGNPDTVLGGLFTRTDRTDKTPDDVTPVTDTVQLEQLQAEVDKYTQIMASPYLMVVNNENPLPEDYEKPNLNELSANPSMELDEVAATQIEKFFADAQTAGYKYVITAAYRTATDQTDAYNTALQANLRAGYTTEEAEALASKSVAKAGESEYQTGLIISFTENRSMTAEEFMQTAFYKYISENNITICDENGIELTKEEIRAYGLGSAFVPDDNVKLSFNITACDGKKFRACFSDDRLSF
jgi:LAS superfamily LD-carboxypeptidase LdcB